MATLRSHEETFAGFPTASLFANCLQHYRTLFIHLGQQTDDTNLNVSLSRLADEYGRVRIWGRNSGADRTGRGSLDEKLRADGKMQTIVSDLLQLLCNEVQRGAP